MFEAAFADIFYLKSADYQNYFVNLQRNCVVYDY